LRKKSPRNARANEGFLITHVYGQYSANEIIWRPLFPRRCRHKPFTSGEPDQAFSLSERGGLVVLGIVKSSSQDVGECGHWP